MTKLPEEIKQQLIEIFQGLNYGFCTELNQLGSIIESLYLENQELKLECEKQTQLAKETFRKYISLNNQMLVAVDVISEVGIK